MSPVPEWKFGAYVDGELSPTEMREVEAELVHSRHARELVLALREEAGLLGEVLQERKREAERPATAGHRHAASPSACRSPSPWSACWLR